MGKSKSEIYIKKRIKRVIIEKKKKKKIVEDMYEGEDVKVKM